MTSTTSIKFRLVRGLMLIVLFFLVQAGLVWYAVDNAKRTVVESTHKNTVASSELGALAVLAQQIRRYEKEYFVYIGNKEKRDSYEREWRDALAGIEANLARMKTGSDGAFNGKDIEQINAWSEASTFYAAEMQKIFLAVAERSAGLQIQKEIAGETALWTKPGDERKIEQAIAGPYRSVEANEMIKEGKDRFSSGLIKGVAAMVKTKTADTLALANVAKETFDRVLIGVMITVAIGVLIALGLSISLPKAVTKTIDGLAAAAEEMSMGNLSKAYDSQGVTEFERLAEALNRMRLGQQALVERMQRRQ